jgi:HSP20 family protein
MKPKSTTQYKKGLLEDTPMTTIVRWNPFREMAAMQSVLDRAFDQAWRGTNWPTTNGHSATFNLDVHETDSNYTVVADLPGLNPDQINVRLHDGILTISAEVAQTEVNEGTRVLLQERFYGSTSRSLNLPQPVNADAVEATYEGGVLTLSLPKVPEVQPRQINIKTNGKVIQSNN